MIRSGDMLRFGEKLRILRQRKGLSQEEVGHLLDVHQTHIGRLERGEKTPNAAVILKLTDLFGVTTDLLMRDELELQ